MLSDQFIGCQRPSAPVSSGVFDSSEFSLDSKMGSVEYNNIQCYFQLMPFMCTSI